MERDINEIEIYVKKTTKMKFLTKKRRKTIYMMNMNKTLQLINITTYF